MSFLFFFCCIFHQFIIFPLIYLTLSILLLGYYLPMSTSTFECTLVDYSIPFFEGPLARVLIILKFALVLTTIIMFEEPFALLHTGNKLALIVYDIVY